VISYPSAVLCHPHLTDAQVYRDVEPYELYKLVEDYNKYYINDFVKDRDSMFERIAKLLFSHRVICFIKGTPQDPFCKFSVAFVELIKKTGIKYKSFNIFLDDGLRCWLRLYSGWKTYPQLYIDGKIVGGLDIMKDLIEKGEFLKLIPDELKY
jgi:Grx4 family monothiol glutaredoxin